MENTSDKNYNVIILSKTTNQFKCSSIYKVCRKTQKVSHRVRYLDILGEGGKGERGRAAASTEQCKE